MEKARRHHSYCWKTALLPGQNHHICARLTTGCISHFCCGHWSFKTPTGPGFCNHTVLSSQACQPVRSHSHDAAALPQTLPLTARAQLCRQDTMWEFLQTSRLWKTSYGQNFKPILPTCFVDELGKRSRSVTHPPSFLVAASPAHQAVRDEKEVGKQCWSQQWAPAISKSREVLRVNKSHTKPTGTQQGAAHLYLISTSPGPKSIINQNVLLSLHNSLKKWVFLS